MYIVTYMYDNVNMQIITYMYTVTYMYDSAYKQIITYVYRITYMYNIDTLEVIIMSNRNVIMLVMNNNPKRGIIIFNKIFQQDYDI